MRSPDQLIDEANRAPFRGWDFTWLRGRAQEIDPPWDYAGLVREAARSARRLLDIDTGGGEFLSRLAPLRSLAVATEGYAPNVALAREQFEGLRIALVHSSSAPDNVEQTGMDALASRSTLPFRDGSFDLVIDRHSSYWPREVWRVLRAGGRFLTQQRGHWGISGADWADLFGRPDSEPRFDAATASEQLRDAGSAVDSARDADTPMTFGDLATVVSYLRAVPWIVEGFDPVKDRDALDRIQRIILGEGHLVVRGSHTLVDARRA
jgi:SAM-dependent methyltransferase